MRTERIRFGANKETGQPCFFQLAVLLSLFASGGWANELPPATKVKSLQDAVVFSVNEPTLDSYAMDLARQSGSDMLMRGCFKWNWAPSLSPAIPEEIHKIGALYGGGITCSVLFEGENGLSHAQVVDMATRSPDGQLVPWPPQRAPGAPIGYHGTLSNPAYIDYLFRWCREQIDAGVDSLFMDERDGALLPQEGYDDYSFSDFRYFLLHPYTASPGWEPGNKRWETEFGIDLKNAQICPSGDMTSFDYRAYLRAKNWLQNPSDSVNPLAGVWKTFRSWRDERAWSMLTSRIHDYAHSKNRQVFITANGFAPYVDFQTSNNWEEDEQIERSGKIDLSQNQLPRWRRMVMMGRGIAEKPVPVVIFHDWGATLPWQAAPADERSVWMRTRGAEIYAAGGFFAFPVLEPHGCDAGKDGTISTIAQQAAFYQLHRDLYLRGRFLGDTTVQTEIPDLSLAVWSGEDPQTVAVHIINRQFTGSHLNQRHNIVVRLPLDQMPQQAVAFSPDWKGNKPAKCALHQGALSVTLKNLEAYAVVQLHYDRPIDISKLYDPFYLR